MSAPSADKSDPNAISRSEQAEKEWLAAHGPLDMERYGEKLLTIMRQVQAAEELSPTQLRRILRKHPRDGQRIFRKHELVRGYRALCRQGRIPFERQTLRRLQMKPTRTISGLAPVTVLTKPYPCPGTCIFCPSDAGMPQSYLAQEPGAMRGAYHDFDPFQQTQSRLRALKNIGHPTDKIELLILGGTWSAYPPDYQEWFIRRCLDAMNERMAPSLRQAQRWNERAPQRNVGLVIETRPDCITLQELARLRRLGVTKVQLGVQSLDDEILVANRRGHRVAQTRQAMQLLRLGGFKIALHWMPNLLGATPESDRRDFERLWQDPALRPDELKIYPCALLESAPLYEVWQRGAYQPYDEATLVQLVAECKKSIPPYCRVNRIVRDIPAPYIVAGNTKNNLRQIVQQHMARQGETCRCIRCREVRREQVDPDRLYLEICIYPTTFSREYFISAVQYDTAKAVTTNREAKAVTTNKDTAKAVTTNPRRLAGFLRLSLPQRNPFFLKNRVSGEVAALVDEIADCAMIREVHVYGPALTIGAEGDGDVQHSGVGRRLIARAEQVARQEGYHRLSVIAATGTRNYYRRWGFKLGKLYMSKDL